MTFSVIIPVYNVEPYIRACLDGVVMSSRRLHAVDAMARVEIVCIDDGSTDGSGDVLDAYVEKVSSLDGENVSFRVVHQTNAGVSAARNLGLDAVTSDWILFVDADDFVRESWLVDVAGMIARHPDADLVGFEKLPYFGKDEWAGDEMSERDVGIRDRIDDVLVGFSVYQFAYRFHLIGDVRFIPLSVGEDLVFVSELLSRSKKCVVTDRREYGYRYRAGSASHEDLSPAKMSDVIAFNCAMFANLAKSGKQIGEAFTKGRGNEWFATLPRIILSHRHDSAWHDVWNQWLNSMRNFAALPCMPERQRRCAAKISQQQTISSVLWNCLLPSWFNRKMSVLWKKV